MQKNRGIIATIILAFIALLIFLFAIGYFTDAHPFGLSNYKKALNVPCGISLSAPKENALVAFPYKVYGYASGCGWDPVAGGIVGTVSVLGPNGLIISQAQLITKDPFGDTPYYFEGTIDVPFSFIQESGLLVVHNELSGADGKEIKIPVRFTSHL